jgi:Domain of unknown function (DUF362)
MRIGRVKLQIDGGFDVAMPRMVKVEQHFPRPRIADASAVVAGEMRAKLDPAGFRGKRIAVGLGSRGIVNLVGVARTVIDELRAWGATPFVVPAMGSHGGATAEGQRAVLEGYGLTELALGAPIVATMDAAVVGETPNGIKVYWDRHALAADGVVVVNRIKPHADFKAEYESGLLKMLTLGLGKHAGAASLHRHGFDRFGELIPLVARTVLEKAPVSFGVALVENAYDETMIAEVVRRDDMLEREKELLRIAKENVATLKLRAIDVLIVDRIGKEISGEGMDPNVTGRPGSYLPGFDAPTIQKIVVCGITPKSQGNGVGIGMADVTTIACVESLDLGAMYTNAVTATILGPARLPLIMNTDREAIAVALKTCPRVEPSRARVVRIGSTLEVHRYELSETYLPELQQRNDLKIVSNPFPMSFTADGRLGQFTEV